jgi:hypothetical protein
MRAPLVIIFLFLPSSHLPSSSSHASVQRAGPATGVGRRGGVARQRVRRPELGGVAKELGTPVSRSSWWPWIRLQKTAARGRRRYCCSAPDPPGRGRWRWDLGWLAPPRGSSFPRRPSCGRHRAPSPSSLEPAAAPPTRRIGRAAPRPTPARPARGGGRHAWPARGGRLPCPRRRSWPVVVAARLGSRRPASGGLLLLVVVQRWLEVRRGLVAVAGGLLSNL